MKNPVLALLIVITAFGCKPVAKILGVEKEDGADFSHFKTYDFYGVNASGDTMPSTFGQRVGILKRTISSELSKRGFTQTASNPDLLINIGINVKHQPQTQEAQPDLNEPVYIAHANYSRKIKDMPATNYKEGTVTLHFVDNIKKKLIWKGSVQGIISGEVKTEESAKSGMALLFNDFPVAVK